MLADFGVSSIIKDEDVWQQTEGTIHCLAPEVCDPSIDQYAGKPVDVWALGVTLFCMTFNTLPFKGTTPYFVMENIRTQPLILPETR